VLYRSNASRVCWSTAVQAGIAYRVYGGLRFFDPEISTRSPTCAAWKIERRHRFLRWSISARHRRAHSGVAADAARAAGTSLARVPRIAARRASLGRVSAIARAGTAALGRSGDAVLDGSGLGAHTRREGRPERVET